MRNVIALLLIAILSGCSSDNENFIENEKNDNLLKIRISSSEEDIKDVELNLSEGTLTVLYNEGVTEEQKEIVRKGDYEFQILNIIPTECEQVEVWNILYNAFKGGPRVGTVPPRDTSRIALNWVGDCKEFIEYNEKAMLTIKYKRGLSFEQKQEVRKRQYNFAIEKIIFTECEQIEIWPIFFIEGTTPNVGTLPSKEIINAEINWEKHCSSL